MICYIQLTISSIAFIATHDSGGTKQSDCYSYDDTYKNPDASKHDST